MGRAALLALVALSSAACQHDYVMQPVPRGYVAPENVRIEAEDGSFVLEAGERFEPPFAVNTFELRGGSWTEETIGLMARDAQTIGAERVRVHVPGRDEPLHGVLMLSEGFEEGGNKPAWRSYIIQVPDEYIAAAEGGLGYVYELGEIGEENAAARQNFAAVRGQSRELYGDEWFSWVLWMSDAPFETLPDDLEAMSPEEREAHAFDEGEAVGPYDLPLSEAKKRTQRTLLTYLGLGLVGLLVSAASAGGA